MRRRLPTWRWGNPPNIDGPPFGPRDWPEDRSNYTNRCSGCDENFIGSPLRSICRECVARAQRYHQWLNVTRFLLALFLTLITSGMLIFIFGHLFGLFD